MKLAKLKTGWRWLEVGETTDPATDWHCYPPGSAKCCYKVEEVFGVIPSINGMLLRQTSTFPNFEWGSSLDNRHACV
jgi:hypothetical protein